MSKSAKWNPHITVACIVEDNGKSLMVEETDPDRAETVINQPAGHLEAGESLQDAAIRETLEETAWDASVEAYLGLYVHTSPDNGISYYRHCFIGTAIKHHSQQALDEGITAARWLDYPYLKAHKEQMRSPLVLKCIDDYLHGKRHPLDIIFEYPNE